MTTQKLQKLQKLQIFTKNKQVIYDGQFHKVDHVVLREYDLYVKLADIKDPVLATKIQCDYSELKLERQFN